MTGEGKVTTSRAKPPGLASPPPPRRLAGGGAAGALYPGEGRGRRGRAGVPAGPGLAGPPSACARHPRGLRKEAVGARFGSRGLLGRRKDKRPGKERGDQGCSEGCVCGGGPDHFLGPAGGAGGTWLPPPLCEGSHPRLTARAPLLHPRPSPAAAAIAAPQVIK
ncbi:unnamed protein product [Pipistrellus nathusii]|uniref:Uncharacterized protein n=1 Tax=Pipistrellus nathusii TaxID=59473 RepID=A0ABN9Z1T8_PIPNA